MTPRRTGPHGPTGDAMPPVDRRQFLRAAAAAGLLPPSLESLAEALEWGYGPDLPAPALPLSPGDYPLRAVPLDRVRITDGFWNLAAATAAIR